MDVKLPKLVEMAETSGEAYERALDIFKQKYVAKQFVVVEFLPDMVPVYEFGSTVQIQNFELLLKFLKFFGHLVQNFQVIFTKMSENEAKQVSASIQNHCAKSLTQLWMIGNGYELEEMQTPFERVENLTLSGKWNAMGSKILKFDQLFPKIRRLQFKYGLAVDDRASIQGTFPQIEHFHTEYRVHDVNASQDAFPQERVIKSLLASNPTIRSLELNYVSERFLANFHSILPQLESLRMEYISIVDGYKRPKVTFKAVKKLSISNWSEFVNPAIMQTIAFKQLEQFIIGWNDTDVDQWLDFIVKCQTIKKFETFGGFMNDDQLVRFGEGLPHLVDANVYTKSKVDTIVRFMKNSKKLEFLTLQRFNDLVLRKDLKKKLGTKWEWHRMPNDNGVRLERKHKFIGIDRFQ